MTKKYLVSVTSILVMLLLILGNCMQPLNDDASPSSLADAKLQRAAAPISVAPSQDPPGGLQPSQVPQFVSIGFDDNAFPDSIHWIADFLKAHNNPAGSGNALTYDGQQTKATFFNTAHYVTADGVITENGVTIADVVASWQRLYNEGHEIGNHSYAHTGTITQADLQQCNDILKNDIGVPVIDGFRAPFLTYDKAGMDVVYNMGFLYDCSIEQPWYTKSGGDDYWPFTLDHTSPYPPRTTLGSYPGMWELPVYTLMIAGTGQIDTGFDWNLWDGKDLNKATVVQTLKNALDARLAGNRAPLTFGAHTDEYSEFKADFEAAAANSHWTDRREAIEEFLLYALSKPEVRIVTYKQIIDWMSNPVALGPLGPTPIPTAVLPTATPTATPIVATPTPTATPTATPVGQYPAWDAQTVYNTNDHVSHAGSVWRAKWYTVGEEPGTTGEWGVWEYVGPAGGDNPTPTPTVSNPTATPTASGPNPTPTPTATPIVVDPTVTPTPTAGTGGACDGVAAWDPAEPWTNYSNGDLRTNAGGLYRCIQPAYSYYEPSGPNGHHGWVFVQTCN